MQIGDAKYYVDVSLGYDDGFLNIYKRYDNK